MESVKQHSEKFLRQRKMMLLLPLMVAPLLSLAFYGLGGGKGTGKRSDIVPGKGLNMVLPEAKFDPKKKAMDKLGFYKQAEQDSLKLLESRRQDPYYTYGERASGSAGVLVPGRRDSGARIFSGAVPSVASYVVSHDVPRVIPGRTEADGQADELLQKLDRLKEVLNRQASAGPAVDRLGSESSRPPLLSRFDGANALVPGGPGVGQVPAMGQGDPDLDKLSGMLDKVLRIQHPEERKLEDTVTPAIEGRRVVPLTGYKKDDTVRTLGVENTRIVDRGYKPGPGSEGDVVEEIPGSGFMDLDGEETPAGVVGDNLVEAVVARDQTLVSGETVELRLSEDALMNGVLIPRGTLLSGRATLAGERLLTTVNSILVGKTAVPVSLELLDLDGLVGIRERGSIGRDVSKESADEAINSVGVTTMDPGLAGQATAAGLQAAKRLMSRKVRLVRLSLKAGYKVLLRNTNVKH